MNLLLVMNLPYEPALGGANKANRILCELLRARGHRVLVLAPAIGIPSELTVEDFERSLQDRHIAVKKMSGVLQFTSEGVEVHAIGDRRQFRKYLIDCIADFGPDWVLVSSEEPTQNLLDAAITSHVRVAYLLHTPTFLPFGPCSFYPSRRRAELLRSVTTIIAASMFSADYVRRWSGLPVQLCYLPVYGSGPYRCLGSIDNEFVTMINPCQYKGIKIFVEVARSLPEVQFAAVPGWGTTPSDLALLVTLPNITVLQPQSDIERIFERTRVLLAPSLWQESFGLIIVEAMLRGIPVIASDVGGTTESMCKTGSLIPVNPITMLSNGLDENQLRTAVVPQQQREPWVKALQMLVYDNQLYHRESSSASTAASHFVSSLTIDDFEKCLPQL